MAKLYKLESSHDRVRGNAAVGEYEEEPTVGKSFIIIGPGIVEGACARMVATSTVQKVSHNSDGSILFETMNSTYLLDPNHEVVQ